MEGYMGNNKLLLIVEPKYAKAAMDIYQEMDKKKFFRAAILDTEKVMEEEHIVRQGALAEEVKAKEKYVQSYINFFLGNDLPGRSCDLQRTASVYNCSIIESSNSPQSILGTIILIRPMINARLA